MLFDEESNILAWPIAKGELSHTVEAGNFLIHVSKAGKPLLVEILDASKFTGEFSNIKILKDLKRIMPANPTNV